MTHPVPLRAPVMVCFGTRPEVIKLAPVIAALESHGELQAITVTTAQHRQMLDQALETHDLRPDVDLDLMTPGQTIDGLAASALSTLGDVIRQHAPRAVVVQGDTTTALCATLAAFWQHVPVAHVEAGLRTWNLTSPFPEEGNRQVIASLARWHFCPTDRSADNLRREGVGEDRIHVTGNTAVDALHHILRTDVGDSFPLRTRARRVLVTMHRRESQGELQRAMLRMLVRVARERDVEFVMPVHPNPAVRAVVLEETADHEGICLLEPVEYAAFVRLMRTSDIILTDSGGMQEEAPALGIPLLVMRATTERPEGVDAGCVRLCGTAPEHVEAELLHLLDDPLACSAMAEAPQPYGDGAAAQRIVDAMARGLQQPDPVHTLSEPVVASRPLHLHPLIPTGTLR